MPRFRVDILCTVDESTSIEVIAANEAEAEKIAEARYEYGEYPAFELDEVQSVDYIARELKDQEQ